MSHFGDYDPGCLSKYDTKREELPKKGERFCEIMSRRDEENEKEEEGLKVMLLKNKKVQSLRISIYPY